MKKILKMVMMIVLSLTLVLTLSSCDLLEKNNTSNVAKSTQTVVKEKNAYDIAKENGFEGTLEEW